jgi:uncharacterized protein (DUF2252 family)
MFDLNDFDETLPGPFEFDVKRMAASFTIAARNNGFSAADTREATLASVTSYRQAMAAFAQMGTMEVWFAHLDEDQVTRAVRAAIGELAKAAKKEPKGARKQAEKRTKEVKKIAKGTRKAAEKAHTRDSLQALSKLGELVDGKYRIVSQPPIVIPARELAARSGISPGEIDELVRQQFDDYRATLREDQRRPLERFQIVDMARKVVGVGSVGTQAFIVLLQGRDAHDPLFLQVKEATASVLEPYVRKSRYRQHGQRVVAGQRMMQAASDIYLGWTKDQEGNRHYYWRQLRDMKGSAEIESMTPTALTLYAWTCGWTLARARPFRGSARHRRVPGRRRYVRQVDQRLLAALRRAERARLPAVREGDPVRSAGSARGRLNTARETSAQQMALLGSPLAPRRCTAMPVACQ